MRTLPWIAAYVAIAGVCIQGEDWPEWRGKGRLGVGNETGIVDKLPVSGLDVLWRTPIKAGYAGPAVAAGRVFVTDFTPRERRRGIERPLALEENTGRILWTREWDVSYGGLGYDVGPRATPTVDGDRVYVLGATGVLLCLDVKTGQILWQKDYGKDYGAAMSAAPLCPGLARPSPGRVYWEIPMKVGQGMSVATPVQSGQRLLVSSFYNGSAMVLLDDKAPTARVVWKGKSDSEIQTDGLHAVINTPIIQGEYIYGICSYGQFRCLNANTGERVWETQEVTKEKAR
jgi:outer membrane protein assembly factor BamB